MDVTDCYHTYKLLKLLRDDVKKEGINMVCQGDHRELSENNLMLRKLDNKLIKHRERCFALLLDK